MGLRRRPIDRESNQAACRGQETCFTDHSADSELPPFNVAAVPAWARLERQRPTQRRAREIANVDADPAASACLPRLLTVAEVAEGLRVSAKTIRRMVARGELQVIRIGRAVRIMETEYIRLVGRR
jgi:excisionase family DNA binding protein